LRRREERAVGRLIRRSPDRAVRNLKALLAGLLITPRRFLGPRGAEALAALLG